MTVIETMVEALERVTYRLARAEKRIADLEAKLEARSDR